jgi:hypothetical protein
MSIAGQHSSKHVSLATNTHATIEEPLEAMFSNVVCTEAM